VAVNPVLRRGQLGPPLAAVGEGVLGRSTRTSWAPWSADSKSHVAHMSDGDFYGSENSTTIAKGDRGPLRVRGRRRHRHGAQEEAGLLEGEILDTSVMHVRALRSFFETQIEDAKQKGLLLSLHLKATMNEGVRPGHVRPRRQRLLQARLRQARGHLRATGRQPDFGLGDLYAKIQAFARRQKAEVEADIKAVYATRPALAMVDSDRGSPTSTSPSDIIVDASMPVVVR